MADSTAKFDARKVGNQEFRDWGGTHLAVYVGRCPVCNRTIYNERDLHIDTGEYGNEYNPDWRGIIGEHSAATLVASEYGYTGDDLNICTICENESERYNRALEIAKSKWKQDESCDNCGRSMTSEQYSEGQGLCFVCIDTIN